MSFPEVHEADAPPQVAAIYAGLREAVGVPLVNLIWRHFAALPGGGVLPWAWEAIRPVARAAALAEGTARMEAAVAALAGPGAVGAFPAATGEAAVVVEIYNRGNCTNLQLLTALRLAVADETGVGGGVPLPAGPPLPPLPAMPRLETLDPATRAAVQALAALHGAEGATVVPSLYRHLALWPDLLPPLHAALAPLVHAGMIARGREALVAEARATANRLLPALRPPPDALLAEQRPAVLAALDAFAGRLIAEMGTVGLLLRARAVAR